MNHLNMNDENLHELIAGMQQLIMEKGLDEHLAIDQVHFGSPLDEHCRQIPVCRQVTDPATGRTRTVCQMETVCD